jgi:hypothetical protein
MRWGKMKKLLIILLLVFLLVGCQQDINPTDVVESPGYIMPKNYIGYASEVYITETIMPREQRLPQKYFTGTYANILYSPVTSELCLTAKVYDTDHRNATYYLVGRKQGQEFFGETRVKFLISDGSGSKSYCFPNVDLSQPYEVLLTKVDADDLNPSSTLDSVNTLTITDSKASQRKHVQLESISDQVLTYFLPDEDPYVCFSVMFHDPGKAFKKLTFVLYHSEDKQIVEEKEIIIDDSFYEDDLLKLENITFDLHIAPNFDYGVQILVDGHDGVDEFNDIEIGQYTYTTKTYEMASDGTSFHGLYAVFTGFEIKGDDVYFYYRYDDQGNMAYADTGELPVFVIVTKTGSYPDYIEETFDFDLTKNYFVLPISQVQQGVGLLIRDQRLKYVFNAFYVVTHEIAIHYYPTYHEPEEKMLTFLLRDVSNANLLSVKIEIVNENNEVLEVIQDVQALFGEFTYTYTGDYDVEGQYFLRFTYEVETLVGPLTHMKEFPLFS